MFPPPIPVQVSCRVPHPGLLVSVFELIWTLNDSFRSVPGPVRLQQGPNRSPDPPPGGCSDGSLVSPEVKKKHSFYRIFSIYCSYLSDHVTGEMLDFNLFISNFSTFFSPFSHPYLEQLLTGLYRTGYFFFYWNLSIIIYLLFTDTDLWSRPFESCGAANF